jgi:predicted nucleic acid-binding protein
MDGSVVDRSFLSSHTRVTDSYLLALARANAGQLATMDQKLAVEVVADGKASVALI